MGRRGRPYSKDPRDKQYIIRMNNDENDILKKCCDITGMGKADVFRTSLLEFYKGNNKKDGE